MRFTPLGAAGTVTGSRLLVEHEDTRVLVDCGLFQGLKELRLRNRAPFPVDPASIDYVVLTHAHLDHTGWLPVLVREGFRGPVVCSTPTAELTPILLADAGRLQEEDARHAGREGYSRHAKPEALFTEADAEDVTPLLVGVPPLEERPLGPLTLRLHPSGHILGATGVELRGTGGSLHVSGDLGRFDDPIVEPPAPPPAVDALVMEATYGDRLHPARDPVEGLAEVVRRTAARGGILMVPSFAVGRALWLVVELHRLRREGRIPHIPVYLNSPMAIRVAHLEMDHAAWHKLPPGTLQAAFGGVTLVMDVEESRALDSRRGPMIIIAGAGMLTGGRILHHISALGDDHRNTLLLTGHQAEGTRGAALLAGARSVRIHGRDVRIAAEVVRLEGLSAHADAAELEGWVASAPAPPRLIRLVHGDPGALASLRERLTLRFGGDVDVARQGESVSVGGVAAAPPGP